MDEGSEKTLQKIFEVAPVGMLLLGENMDVIQANSTLGTMILREPSEIIGKRGGEGLECIHSKEDPRGCGFSNSCPNCPLRNGVELVLKSGDTIRNAEFQPTLLIDGKEISPWLSINTEPIILEGKKHVIVALSDITEQKRVEEALRKSESFQRSIVAAFPDYLFILDTEGTIQKVNRVQAGHREQDVVGQKAVKFMPPEYREDFEGALRQAVDTGQIQAVETMVDLPDGCHWFFNRLSPTTLDGEEESIVLIAIDITERKRAENKMQEYLEEIESINEKLDAYSYSISHDLKEPIRAIRTFSDFISEDYTDKLDDKAKDYFSRIIKASDKMTRMIDDLLVLSQVGRKDMEFRAVSVLDLIEEVKDTLRHKIEETNTTISTHGFPTIICQPVWMKAVFQNLVSNSIKYNDKEKTHIEITCRDLPTHYEFAVKDNGLGIHKDYYDRIFALFNKAHQDRNMEGSGAGLAIVASVVEQHQGRVWVDWSKPKEGTIIKFTIDKSLSGNKGIDNRG